MGKSVKTSSNNGGIMGSGVFGVFGTTIQCPASDTSFYCSFMKIFNVLIVIFVVFVILYMAYTYLMPNSFRNKRR